jgi:Na+-translocating ferredoxin:NAD+ oxidoreductase RnfG subunit
VVVPAACLLGVLGGGRAHAQAVRLTQEEALRLAFPAPAVVERRTAYLTAAQLARVAELAGRDARAETAVVTYYTATRGDSVLGAAYFDAHRVRSLREVLMVVVTAAGRVRRVEVVKFEEPPDYLPPVAWLRQLEGRALDDDLALAGAIATMSGATLTSRATVRATRRALALHAVIAPFGPV